MAWNYSKILAWQRYSLKSEIYLSISLSHCLQTDDVDDTGEYGFSENQSGDGNFAINSGDSVVSNDPDDEDDVNGQIKIIKKMPMITAMNIHDGNDRLGGRRVPLVKSCHLSMISMISSRFLGFIGLSEKSRL